MFIKNDLNQIKKRITEILDSEPTLEVGDLDHKIAAVFPKRERLLQIAEEHQAACYVIDKQELDTSMSTFKETFQKHIPNLHIYYAMKANSHPYVVAGAVRHGLGVDVSSGRELLIALKSGAKSLLFTGPGKTVEELRLATKHQSKIIVNIDSFSELERLRQVTKDLKKPLRCGIRVYSKVLGKWSKFGIPLQDLKMFWHEAQTIPGISLEGIQFHMSFNETTEAFETMFKEVGEYIASEFTEDERKQIQYIDFGGGYISYKSRAFYPNASLRGMIIDAANDFFFDKTKYVEKYYVDHALPLEKYAERIGTFIQLYISPHVDCQFFCEPGRILVDNVMHLIVKVVDIKDKDHLITDAGTNMMGWRVHDKEHLPVLNLTHPSMNEVPFTLFGSLCMPNDIWSKYCYASEMHEGDYLLIPFHGSYTYSFAQDFIKPVPEVVLMNEMI